MGAAEGWKFGAAVAVEGAVVALLHAAWFPTGAPLAVAVGYAGAILLRWAAARRVGASPRPDVASGCSSLERRASWTAAGLTLAAVVLAGRLAGTAAWPHATPLAILTWSLGWGLRLASRAPWVVALMGWLTVAGVQALVRGDGGPAANQLAWWMCLTALVAWAMGRSLAAEAAVLERVSELNRRQARVCEQEQSLFALHDLIEREAGDWTPAEWGERALERVAAIVGVHEVALMVPGPDAGCWEPYATWPATAPPPDPSVMASLPLRPDLQPPVCQPLSPREVACRVRIAGGEPGWGWLIVRRAPWQGRITPEEQRLVERLAQHWDAAVDNVVTYTQNQRRARHLAILHEISRAMARPLRLEPLFETIFREVARVMPVEAFVITLYEPEKEALHAAFIVDKGQRYAPVTLPADRGPTVEVVRTGRPLFINRRPEEMDRPVPGRRLVGVPEEPASAIIVPMILESRVVGTISAQAYRPGAYTQEDFELLATIAGQAAIYVENARLYEQTVQLAMTDSMTGLGNARMLRRELARELARARRSGAPLSLIMLDSDHLKEVNDRYGHLVGDRYLALLADVIRAHVRAGDIVTRYGGDEFVVVLPETPLEDAERVAERIVGAVARTPLLVGQERVFTSASAGVAVYPVCGEDEEQLLRAVDRALYEAKRAGKGRVHCLARA
ncbi:MAG TPA: sensor domain-containing diguanylate cyclase [Limnochordales bacterium]